MRSRLVNMAVLALCFVVVAIFAPVHAQTNPVSLKLVKAQAVADLIGAPNVRWATLSPDGATIAYANADKTKGLCLYTLTNGQTACTPWPTPGFGGLEAFLYWSPDGKTIALTESTFMAFVDSDIWVFDVGAQTFADRTDDGVAGGFFGSSGMRPSAVLDYLPVWNPATGDLYFFRTEPAGASDSAAFTAMSTPLTLSLYRLSPAGGDAKLVRDLASDLKAMQHPFPVFPSTRRFLEGPAAISPDGKQLAVSLRSQDLKDATDGIWLLDLAGGASKQVVSSAGGFTAGMPSWAAPVNSVDALAWTADGSGLLFAASNIKAADPLIDQNFYSVDLKTGTVTPLLDFSRYASRDDFSASGAGKNAPAFNVPSTGVFLASKGCFVAFLGRTKWGKPGVSAQCLPPAQAEPTWLGEVQDYKEVQTNTDSVSADGKTVLMYGYLLTFE
jgi:hypothetical protein